MKAARLVGMAGGAADADHHLGAGDEGGDQRAPADAALLRHRKPRRQQRRARMHAGARAGEIVEFERMRQRAIGERGHRRGDERAARSEDAALAAARAHALRIADDDLAPRQAVAEHDGRDRVGDGRLGARDDGRRQVLIAQRGGVFGQSRGLVRHRVSPAWGCG